MECGIRSYTLNGKMLDCKTCPYIRLGGMNDTILYGGTVCNDAQRRYACMS